MTPLGKSAVITGNFTQQQAENLARLLKLRMVPIDQNADKKLKEIEDIATNLTEEKLTGLKADEIVKNLFYVELAGHDEKSNWFILPDSPVEKVWKELDLKKCMEEGQTLYFSIKMKLAHYLIIRCETILH